MIQVQWPFINKPEQFLFMHVDQRYIQNIQNENMMLRQENGRLSGVAKTLDQKYHKSLKQMSSIILANQNLKKQLDNLKTAVKDQIEIAVKEVRAGYQQKLEQIVVEKNEIYINNQNLQREKQQLQRDYSMLERNVWEFQSLKTQITSLKKQNEKLLLQTHPLTQNKDNPQLKVVEQKLEKKIDDLNLKIIELNVENTQSKKYAESIENEKKNLVAQVSSLNKKINELTSALDKSNHKNSKDESIESEHKSLQTKKAQIQVMDLRKKNAELTNQLQKIKLEKLEMTSEINKNQAEMHLLNTLKTLHSQLEPMRYQMEELKRDKYFDRQNTNKEKAELHLKLLSSQHQIEILKQLLKDLESRNKQLGQELRQKQWEKSKYQELEEDKRILQGRVIVYQAMQMVSRNREKPHHVERLQEFQRRIQLLLEEENLQYLVNNANVHQLIAMKAYIIELDNKLQVVGEQSEHFHKKYGQYKQKYKIMLEDNKQMLNKHYATINAYKGKISGYEKLVIKLTAELQKFIKDSQGPSDIESHYNSVITLYESKITSIYNQVNSRKQENRDLLKKYDNLQLEYKGKLALIREIEGEVSKLKARNKQLENKLTVQELDEGPRSSLSSIPQDHYKSIISQKTKYILQLEESLSKYKFKIDKMQFEHDRDLDDYKHKINRLEMQVQHLRLEQQSANKQLSTAKHSEQFGELVYKLSSLQKNVAAISQSQVNLNQPRESNGDLQRQIESLRAENKYLMDDIEALRTELKNRKNEQNNLWFSRQINNEDQFSRFRDIANKNILELQKRISELDNQLKIKEKQLELKDRQIERLSSSKENKQSVEVPSKNNNRLEEQNATLRAQLDKIMGNYRNMTIESEGLMHKIRETEAYIADLKEEFNRVCNKMNEYEKQLNVKDQKLHEWSLKFKNLQQKYEEQLRNAKPATSKYNEKEIEDKIRKISESQHQIERAFRQIESKLRDIERRQMEANRRDSQIDIKNKDLKDRLRKLEERQAIVNNQQNRLIRLSQDLDQRERRIQTTTIQPTNTFSPQTPQHSYKEEYNELERKFKRLEIDLSEKAKIIQIKDEKMDKLIKEKAQINNAFQNMKNSFQEKLKAAEYNERQVTSLKQQIQRLEGELEKLWKQFDLLKQQLRGKERQLGDLNLEKDQLRKKFEIQMRQLSYKIKQLQNTRPSQQPIIRQPNPNMNLDEIEKQFEDRLRQMEEKHKQKIRQLYKENQDSTRDLQQMISDLTLEINRLKSHVLSPVQNKNQIQAHTATIQSLESHIKTLEEEVKRKQDIIRQLEEDLSYYRNILGQREQQIQKLYESSLLPTSHGDNDNADKLRLQNQIISLQMMLQSKHNQSIDNHDECIRKEHLLRMEIERISAILQSKNTEQGSEKPQSPRSQYLDNSYLNELEETNKNLQSDIALLKQRLVAQFDNSRSIDEFLTIMVLTFAEVDALRLRLYEMEQNFKQEHQRQLNVIKQMDELKQYDVDKSKIEAIIKDMEIAHRAFHEQESRSKTAFIKRINTQVLVLPGSQAMSISDEISRTKQQEQSIIHHITEEVSSSSNRLGSFDIPKFSEEHPKIDYGERSIKNSLAEDSTIQQPLTISNQFSFQPVTLSNTNTGLGTGFRPEFQTQFTGLTGLTGMSGLTGGNYNFNQPAPINVNFTKSGGFSTNPLSQPLSFNTGPTTSQFTNFGPTNSPYTSINRPTTFSTFNQPTSNIGVPPPRVPEQISPNKRFQTTQPYQFYQYSEGSQSSLRFPSQTNLTSPPSVNFRPSETHVTPYIVSNNQLMR